MRSKLVGVLVAATMMAVTAGSAKADTTYDFTWPGGETCFFKFASSTCLAIGSTTRDTWEADVDDSDPSDAPITVFDSANDYLHDTGDTIFASTLYAKFVITDVEGSVDFTDATAVWTFTGYVVFSASGYISQSSCKTSSFNVSFSGGYISPTDSSAFTIPSFSGSGTQACGGYYSGLNTTFDLGTSGAKLHFNKFVITAL
jgi:hypothetical protein